MIRPRSTRATGRYATRGLSDSNPMYGSSRRGLTRYQIELMPYLQQKMQQEEARARRARPLEWIFDRLSTGQYLSANLVNEFLDVTMGDGDGQFNLGQAIGGAIRGDVEGDYTDIARRLGVKDEAAIDKPILRSLTNPSKLLGFLGNVALDPLTYVSFGATTAAKNAAREAGENAVRLWMKNGDNLRRLEELVPEGFKRESFRRLATRNPEKARRLVQGMGNQNVAREMDSIYKRAYREGLRMNEQQGREKLMGELFRTFDRNNVDLVREAAERYTHKRAQTIRKLMDQNPKNAEKYADKLAELTSQRGVDKVIFDTMGALGGQRGLYGAMPDGMRNELRSLIGGRQIGDMSSNVVRQFGGTQHLGDPITARLKELTEDFKGFDPFEADRMLSSIKGMGETAFQTLMGKEFGAKVRPWVGRVREQMETIRDSLRQTKGGKLLSDAWYTVMQKGPVGAIRRRLGFRNAYQEMLEQKSLQAASESRDIADQYFQRLNPVLKQVGDDTQALYVRLRSRMSGMNKQRLNERANQVVLNMARQRGYVAETAHELPQDIYDSVVAQLGGWDGLKSMVVREDPLVAAYLGMDDYDSFEFATLQDAIDDMEDRGNFLQPQEIEQVNSLHQKIEPVLEDMFRRESEWAERGIYESFDITDDMMPHMVRHTMPENRISDVAKENANFFGQRGRVDEPMDVARKTRRQGTERAADAEARRLSMIYGLGSDEAEQMVWEKGMGSTITDLGSIIGERILRHASLGKRAYIVESFRPFGIKLNEIAENAHKLRVRGIAEDGLDTNRNPLARRSAAELEDGTFYDDRLVENLSQADVHERLGMKMVDDPSFEGELFDKDVAEVLERALQIGEQKNLNVFAKALGTFTPWWKAAVTATPQFHLRNWMSNNITGYIRHGARWFNPKASYAAWIGARVALEGKQKVMNSLGWNEVKLNKWLKNASWGGRPLDEWVQYAKRKNIISESTQSFDRIEKTKEMLGRGVESNLNPLSTKFKGYQLSHNVGSQIESAGRFQSFLMDIQQMAGAGTATDSMAEGAMLNAKKWFLDYDDLTDFERNVLKGVIPFYSWMRKNIVNQLSSLTQPEMLQRTASFAKYRDFLTNGEVDPELMRPDQRNAGAVVSGFNPESGEAQLLYTAAPLIDLNNIPLGFTEDGEPVFEGFDLLNTVAQGAHPFLKAAVEWKTGQDTFLDRPIPAQQVAPDALRILNRTPWVTNVLDGALRMAGYDNGLAADIDAEGRFVMDGKIVQLLETVLPLLNTMERFRDGPEELAKQLNIGLEEGISKAMQAEDEYDGLRELLRTMSFWTGVRQEAINEDDARYYRASAMYHQARDEEQRNRELNADYLLNRQRYRMQREQMYRKLGIY